MRRLHALTLALLVLTAGAAAGCGDDDDTSSAGTDSTDSTGTTGTSGSSGDQATDDTAAAAALRGRTFLSEAITEDGAPRPLVAGTRVELTFHDDGRLTASAGCNSMSGGVGIGADRLTVADLATTEMGCDPERHAQDEWLSGLLTAGPTYGLEEAVLRLTSGTTEMIMTDREIADPDRPLEGTTWQLDGLISADAVSSVPAGAGATLVFEAGSVAVTVEGCNQGRASVQVTETTMQIGPLAMTRMACPPPGSEVEAAIVAVLDGEISYTIEAGSLTLQHPGGQGLMLRG